MPTLDTTLGRREAGDAGIGGEQRGLARRAAPRSRQSKLCYCRHIRQRPAGRRQESLYPLRCSLASSRTASFRSCMPDLSKSVCITELLTHRCNGLGLESAHPPTYRDVGTEHGCVDPFPCVNQDTPATSKAMYPRATPFREELGSNPYTMDSEGNVRPLEKPGIGIEVDVGLPAQASGDRRSRIRLIGEVPSPA